MTFKKYISSLKVSLKECITFHLKRIVSADISKIPMQFYIRHQNHHVLVILKGSSKGRFFYALCNTVPSHIKIIYTKKLKPQKSVYQNNKNAQ